MAAPACAQREAKTTHGTAIYRRRRPGHSAVYQVVQGHLETWLADCRHADEAGFPVAAHIEQGLRLDRAKILPVLSWIVLNTPLCELIIE